MRRPAKVAVERAQRILDQRPVHDTTSYRAHQDLMREIAATEGVSVESVRKIWRRQSYGYLKRSEGAQA